MLGIKDCSLISIKFKLKILYLLNVSDIILTLILVNSGYFIEANPIMRAIIKQPLTVVALKLILPLALLYLLSIRIKKSTIRQLEISNRLINFSLLTYILVNLSHVIWGILLSSLFLFL